MLDLFGGINIGLAEVFQAGILVRKYFYMAKDETRRGFHHTILHY